MYHGISESTVSWTTQEITTLEKIMTSNIILINGVVITWVTNIKKTVTLSVTKAEYSAITKVCCEIIFSPEILFLRELFFNNPLPFTPNKLDQYCYQITHWYPNGILT